MSQSETKWSDINKVKFFAVGTGMYTAIILILHPITVIKTRQQVLLTNTRESFLSTVQSAFHNRKSNNKSTLESMATSNKINHPVRSLYRGVGIILLLAIPARVVYISTLEVSREFIQKKISNLLPKISQQYHHHDNRNHTTASNSYFPFSLYDNQRYDYVISNFGKISAALSGGLAGGIAAMSTQLIVVPMDVISQRQMVMDEKSYKQGYGNAFEIIKRILQNEGMKGLYRGFGLSLFSSLPTGSIWWGTYSGCQYTLQSIPFFRQSDFQNYDQSIPSIMNTNMFKTGLSQILSGLCAAVVASTITQPIDVIKTRMQVGKEYSNRNNKVEYPLSNQASHISHPQTYTSVAKSLFQSSGYRGFYHGLFPRILHMGLWGTIMSLHMNIYDTFQRTRAHYNIGKLKYNFDYCLILTVVE